MNSQWTTVLHAADLAAFTALTASIDPCFAKQERSFWQSRTVNQLRVLVDQAWQCNDGHGYQMARSWLAQLERNTQ